MKQKGSKKINIGEKKLKLMLLLSLCIQIVIFLVSRYYYGLKLMKLDFAKPLILNLAFLISLMPLIFILISKGFESIGKIKSADLFISLSFPLLIAAIFAAISLCFYPPYCSHSVNTKYYPLPKEAGDELISITESILPEKTSIIDLKTQYYSYFKYKNYQGENIKLSYKQKFSKDSFLKEKERLLSLLDLDNLEVSENENLIFMDFSKNENIIFSIILDKSCNEILYMMNFVNSTYNP